MKSMLNCESRKFEIFLNVSAQCYAFYRSTKALINVP